MITIVKEKPDLADLQESVIRIRFGILDPDTQKFKEMGSGSGIVLSEDGLVATAAHVVERSSAIEHSQNPSIFGFGFQGINLKDLT